jgi:copper(I)-binding protein
MKTSSANLALVLSFIVTGGLAQTPPPTATVAPPLAPATATNRVGPKIDIAVKEHDFGKIGAGATVKCDFLVTNVGDALLEINGVTTSCGCTTAGDWPRKLEPGQGGKIPIQFTASTFGGPTMKTVTVSSNDKEHPSVGLQIKATVWKPVDANPQFAVMYANPETVANAKSTVRIVNNEDQPLTLSVPESSNPAFAAELKTTQPGKEFDLLVSVVPKPNMGNVQGQISMKTSSTNVPVLSITAMVVMQPLMTISPPQVNLPATPLAAKLSYGVSIRYAGTNVMALSDPTVNAKDVTTELKETELGHGFNVALSFPAGFEVPAGQSLEFSVKSSHPDFQVIKVPITQPPRRVAAAAPVAPVGR